MNSGTRSLAAGHAPGVPGSLPPVRTARPAARRRAGRPVLKPWPLFSGLGPVGALPTAPGLARGFTAMVLGGWDMASRGDLIDVSTLIVTELSSNVVDRATSADGSPVYQSDGRVAVLWLRLMTDRDALGIEIWDNLPPSAGVPVLRRPEATEEHGRGLELVQGLSRDWGWHPVPGKRAKCTWAILDAGQRPVPVPARG
jgi:hypothetical protein